MDSNTGHRAGSSDRIRPRIQTTLYHLVETGNKRHALFVMQLFHAKMVVEKDGQLHLEHLSFSEGETVHVCVFSAMPVTGQPLKGSVLKYEQPFTPVTLDSEDGRSFNS